MRRKVAPLNPAQYEAQIGLGTDYPYDMGVEDPIGFIDGAKKLSKKDKEQIMGGNAARLLGINYTSRTRRRS